MRRLIASNRLFPVLLIVSVIFFALPIHAQDLASITGVVTDPSDAVVPGVAVTLENPSTGAIFKTETNSVGSYSIGHVPPGPGYKITFSRSGFNTEVITGLYLNVNVTRTQNAAMAIGAETQSVEVSASSETVTLNTNDATVGNNFQVQLLDDLPVANRDNPAVLFTLEPGVNSAGSVTGSRDDQSSVTVDGLDVNDMATGNFGQIIAHAPVDSVQEFRGVTAGMTADESLGGGGHFDLVTRSGNNHYHGDVNWYHRDTDTQANSWFSNFSGIPRAPLIRNQFGGALGGPIKREKAFFFFDYDGRKDTLSNVVVRTVPTTQFKQKQLGYNSTSGVKYLSAAQVLAMDPSGKGFDQSVIDLFNSRYPDPNYTSTGNGYSTSGYRFNAPFPFTENIYVGRLDYNLSDNIKLWGRFTVSRQDSVQNAQQFPKDPVLTSPFQDRSRAWVVGSTWVINSRMTNSAAWGQTVTDWSFANTFNPQGQTQFTFGSTASGGTIFSQPYPSAVNAQRRTYPIPVIRDDLTIANGKHNFQLGGEFKYVNPDFTTILNYNQPSVGMGGYLNSSLSSFERPADIASGTTTYDAAFATAIGHYASQNSTYNYNAQGSPLTQGSGLTHHYRYYEMEFYFQDNFKIRPNLTINYGLSWTNYTIPYDKNGIESAPSLDFNTYWNDRLKQSAAGDDSGNGFPLITYNLSGKANHQQGIFNPATSNFGPHVGFTYLPVWDKKGVLSAGAGIDYDRTVVAALLYQQSQYSYLFQASTSAKYGSPAGADPSLTGDARFSGISTPVAAPAAPVITKPFYPYATNDQCAAFGESPCGLVNGQAFNEAVDKNFKTPYSINLSFGYQHEFPKGFLLKTNYVGRLGRRLMAQADVNQLIDFPDNSSGQSMSDAIVKLETQIRAGIASTGNPNYYTSVSHANTITPQPWIEDLVGNYYSVFHSSTAEVTYFFNSLLNIGDFADTVEGLSNFDNYNVGMGSQFSEFTYYTNKGFSNYHGFLATLHKNSGFGLQFDLNYTYSKSIDNVSVDANTVAFGGYGFICDVNRPRECRGPSDFDNRHVITGNFTYELPFGRGKMFGATMPRVADEIVGGWSLSALPSWRTGYPWFAVSNAFVAGYANNAPGILTGSIANVKPHPHKDSSTGLMTMFTSPSTALSSFGPPTGFNIGSRNNLRGNHFTNYDMGLGKIFPLYRESIKLRFRADAFNVFNHPSFGIPVNNSSQDDQDITQTNGVFGRVSTTSSTARVLQGSLRVEF